MSAFIVLSQLILIRTGLINSFFALLLDDALAITSMGSVSYTSVLLFELL